MIDIAPSAKESMKEVDRATGKQNSSGQKMSFKK